MSTPLPAMAVKMPPMKPVTTWGQCYKTFYGRNLRIFVISWSVCSWKVLPA
jgi:hypothetical protein